MRAIIPRTLAAAMLAGCACHETPPAPQAGAPPWAGMRQVLWTDYFGCTSHEIRFLQDSRDYDDCDMFFMLFVSREADAPLREVVREYDRNGGSLYATARAYNIPDDRIYSPEVSSDLSYPGPYGTSYDRLRKGKRRALTNEECRALVDLKIGIDHFGYRAPSYLSEYGRIRREGANHPFRVMVARESWRAGTGPRILVKKSTVARSSPPDTGTGPVTPRIVKRLPVSDGPVRSRVGIPARIVDTTFWGSPPPTDEEETSDSILPYYSQVALRGEQPFKFLSPPAAVVRTVDRQGSSGSHEWTSFPLDPVTVRSGARWPSSTSASSDTGGGTSFSDDSFSTGSGSSSSRSRNRSSSSRSATVSKRGGSRGLPSAGRSRSAPIPKAASRFRKRR